ncbi:MAG: hypothetical protein ACK5B9_00790 [Flavobacteriia bacterium]|jgi:hypothetical protein
MAFRENFNGAVRTSQKQLYKGTKQGYNFLESSDPKKVFKVVFMVIGLIVAFIMGKSIIEFVKKLFGMDALSQEQKEEQKAIEKELNKQDTNTSWNPFDTSYSTGKDTYGDLGATQDVKHEGLWYDKKSKLWLTTDETKKKIRALVDNIYVLNNGYNFQYYPDVVNKLANLHYAKLKYATYYWNTKYKAQEGESLYEFLDGQMSGFGYYDPALSVLKKNKLTK